MSQTDRITNQVVMEKKMDFFIVIKVQKLEYIGCINATKEPNLYCNERSKEKKFGKKNLDQTIFATRIKKP